MTLYTWTRLLPEMNFSALTSTRVEPSRIPDVQGE